MMVIEILVTRDWAVFGQLVSWSRSEENGVALIAGIQRHIFQSYDGDGYIALSDGESQIYQQASEIVPLMEAEVLDMVARCSDGSEAWTIYDGVGAWQTFYGGYCQSENSAVLLTRLSLFPSDVLYELRSRFVFFWNLKHRSPVRKEVQK